MKRTSRGIFITGTDTGVGKTWIAEGIAAGLKARGTDIGVMKPAESGCSLRKGVLVPADAKILMKAARVRDRLDEVNPYRFRKPLAPSIAAAEEGRQIAPARILKAFGRLSRKHSWLIVEGAGGIMVPLAGRYTYLDLAADLGLPVLIVSRPGLGTINHTLLTVSALRSRNVDIAGIVINQATKGKTGLAEQTNPKVIRELSDVPVIGMVKHGSRNMEQIMEGICSLLPIQEGAGTKR